MFRMHPFEHSDFIHEENKVTLADGGVMDDARRYEALKRACAAACYAYYALDAPIMQDGEYDVSFDNLRYYETVHPQFDKRDSPTQFVGWNDAMVGLLPVGAQAAR